MMTFKRLLSVVLVTMLMLTAIPVMTAQAVSTVKIKWNANVGKV